MLVYATQAYTKKSQWIFVLVVVLFPPPPPLYESTNTEHVGYASEILFLVNTATELATLPNLKTTRSPQQRP